MPSRYNEENVHRGKTPYKVLRQLVQTDQTYAREIADETGVSYSDASTILNLFERMSIAEEAERTKSQNYKISYEGLTNYFKSLWGQESLFRNFSSFLQGYVQDYTLSNKESTLEDMLQDEFLQGLHTYLDVSDDNLEGVREVYADLIEKREVKDSPRRFIETGIKHLRDT